MHVSYIVNAFALTPTMYIWPWLLNREAERQKDLQKKFPEVSNSEPSKTKTQQVSEKACDMCVFIVLFALLSVCKMSCSILATWPYGSSLMKACKKQKLDKPGQQSIGGSKKDSSIFKLPEMLKSCSVLGYSDYVLPRSNISAIHVDTVRRWNGKRTILQFMEFLLVMVLLAKRIHWKTPKRRRMHQSRSRRWDHATKYFVF